jgi:hypothetical protein
MPSWGIAYAGIRVRSARWLPRPGGEYVLSSDLGDLTELFDLLGNGEELALRVTDVICDRLTVIGEAALGDHTMEVVLEFLADSQDANAIVSGVTARIEGVIELVAAAGAWALDLTEAPRAFIGDLAGLAAHYDLTVGSVAITARTEHLRLVFARPTAAVPLVALIGIKDTAAYLPELPYLGDELLGGEAIGVRGVQLAVIAPGTVTAEQGAALNAALAAAVAGGDDAGDWPLMPDHDLEAGLWVGAAFVLPSEGPRVWMVRLQVPGTPSGTSWRPNFSGICLGTFNLSGFGVSWSWGSGGGDGSPDSVGFTFDADFDLGWLTLKLPELGFDFALPNIGAVIVRSRLPWLSLTLAGREITFTVPTGPDLPDIPGFPGLPGPGLLTGWWQGTPGLGIPSLFELLGLTLPDELPDVFTSTLPALSLRFDLTLGDFGLIVEIGQLRLVFAGLADLDWSDPWRFAALLGLEGLSASLGDLPFIGDLIPSLEFGLNGLSIAAIGPPGLRGDLVGRLNAWLTRLAVDLGVWWPKLPDGAAPCGVSLDVSWRLPSLPSLDWGLPWPPTGTPIVSWKELPSLEFGPLELPKIGLSWPAGSGGGGGGGWDFSLVFDAGFDIGGLRIALPGLGFDIGFSPLSIRPRFPSIALGPPGFMLFTIPAIPSPPPVAVTAVWEDPDGVSAKNVAAALGLDLSTLPEMLTPDLFQAALHYDFSNGLLLLTATTRHLGWVLAAEPVEATPNSLRRFAVASRGRVIARASDLPLVGESITIDRDLVLTGVEFAYASAVWSVGRVEAVNAVLEDVDAADPRQLPRFLDEELLRGALAWVIVTADGEEMPPLVLRLGTLGQALAAGQSVVLGGERRAGDASSGEIDKVFGPVRFRSAGLSYKNGSLFVSFDAILTVGPAQLALFGLGIGFSPQFTVSYALRGAGVVLDKSPLKISGMLERRTGSGLKEQITGLIAVETGFFALQAMGSYAKSLDGWSSMFLFGEIAATGERGLFGPPPFTVVAISLGFGVNSTVRVPTIDEVGTFPLVQRLAGASGTSPEEVLEDLAGEGGWITPRVGQYWGAGGLEFTSFRFIECRALLLIEGGQEWQVLLLGRATLDFPRNKSSKKPMARVVIDLAIAYSQRQQLFSMDVVVAPGSYIIDPAAELTGGLSLRIWGNGSPAGRGFLFTMGGYHKDFRRPSYYPDVPRVGWKWARGGVSIRGEVYAAVTDAAFMAGGRLEARYDKGHGIRLEAWLIAWVDALVQWKPFYFTLSMGISVGVAATVKVLFVRVRVSLEVGVSLDLWGPPVGGTARVKVWFISFTIGIGSRQDTAELPGWGEFRVQLPGPLAIVPERGILADADPGEIAARAANDDPLLVTIDGFAFTTTTSVPATKAVVNTAWERTRTAVNIRPMGKFGATSVHRVTVKQGNTEFDPEAEGWTVAEVTQGMPAALWGARLANPGDALKDELVPNCLSGIRFEVPEPEKEGELGPVLASALGTEPLQPVKIPLCDPDPAGPAPDEDADSIATIVDGIATIATNGKRDVLYAGLAALGADPGSNDGLDGFAQRARRWFTDSPLITEAAQ